MVTPWWPLTLAWVGGQVCGRGHDSCSNGALTLAVGGGCGHGHAMVASHPRMGGGPGAWAWSCHGGTLTLAWVGQRGAACGWGGEAQGWWYPHPHGGAGVVMPLICPRSGHMCNNLLFWPQGTQEALRGSTVRSSEVRSEVEEGKLVARTLDGTSTTTEPPRRLDHRRAEDNSHRSAETAQPLKYQG